MPYHIGSKGSGGCSGFPVMTDTGKVVGCHPTKAEATNHLQALYANVPDASKADTPMDVAYNAVVTDPTPANPSSHINPAVGMRKPQIINFGRQVGPGIHDKRVVEIMRVPFLGKFDNTKQEIGSYVPPIPSPLDSNQEIKQCEYDGCGCPTCKEMNVCCDICPVCQANEMKSDCCGDVSKADPCWEGYVQRGMKEKDGKMVPNCVPVKKMEDSMLFKNFAKEVNKPQRITELFKRDFTAEQRRQEASAGHAMPDGSYPISNRQDLMNAIRSWGRGGAKPAVKEHIKRRARALGLTDMIPENWK